MKSKDQELAILHQAITDLGQNTYLGPWLAAIVDEVEQDIRGDLFPTRTLRETQAECNRQLAACNDLCREHKERTRKECEALTNTTQKQCQAVRDRCFSQLNSALRELGY